MSVLPSFLRRCIVGLPSLRVSVPRIDDTDDLDVTELLSILPSDTETYHLQLKAGTILTVSLQSDDLLGLRLLEEDIWQAAGTAEARRTAPYCYSVPFARNTVIEFTAPHSGDFLLLVWNDSDVPANVLIALSSRRQNCPSLQSPPESVECVSAPRRRELLAASVVWWTVTRLAGRRIGSCLRTLLDRVGSEWT